MTFFTSLLERKAIANSERAKDETCTAFAVLINLQWLDPACSEMRSPSRAEFTHPFRDARRIPPDAQHQHVQR